MARRGLRGLGLRRDDRRRLGGGDAGRGRAVLDAARVGHGARSPPSSAGSRRASCTPPSWPPTRCTARSARAARADAALAPDPRRTLVAMSGGVDSAVAALLVDARARGRRGHARAVGATRRTTPRRRAAPRTRCGVARSVAHGMGMPHFTLDLRAEFRAGVVDPFLAGHAAGRDAEPVRALQRPRAARRDARRSPTALGAADLATGHYARVTRGRAAARRRRPGQGPDLHARARWRRRRWRGCASRSAS